MTRDRFDDVVRFPGLEQAGDDGVSQVVETQSAEAGMLCMRTSCRRRVSPWPFSLKPSPRAISGIEPYASDKDDLHGRSADVVGTVSTLARRRGVSTEEMSQALRANAARVFACAGFQEM